MPIALLLRVLVRVVGGLLFWRFVTARRGTYAARRPPVRATTPPPRLLVRDRVARLREGVSFAWRVGALAVLIIASAVLIAGGLGPAILGPRWLGIALLVLAVAALSAAVVEGFAVRRQFAVRTRRRHDKELAEQVYH
jgi:hypothetical protein